MNRRTRTLTQVAVALVALLTMSACGAKSGQEASTPPGTMAGEMDHANMDMGGGDFGRPGKAADADRVIDIVQTDGPSFEPSEVTVRPGETVTFRVHNDGQAPHEFVLGDDDVQEGHSEEMMGLEDGAILMPDEPNALSLASGEVDTITWIFPDSGEVIYACHVAGHFEAGMTGRVRIE